MTCREFDLISFMLFDARFVSGFVNQIQELKVKRQLIRKNQKLKLTKMDPESPIKI